MVQLRVRTTDELSLDEGRLVCPSPSGRTIPRALFVLFFRSDSTLFPAPGRPLDSSRRRIEIPPPLVFEPLLCPFFSNPRNSLSNHPNFTFCTSSPVRRPFFPCTSEQASLADSSHLCRFQWCFPVLRFVCWVLSERIPVPLPRIRSGAPTYQLSGSIGCGPLN